MSDAKFVPFYAALVVAGLVSSAVYAQSNDLSSVLDKAQKSLGTQSNKTVETKTNPPSATIAPILKTSDLYLQTSLKFDPSSKLWYFPQDAVLNFAKPNKICPQAPCRQQMEDVTLDPNITGQEYFIAGGLKMEDKKASAVDLISWKLYQIVGWSLKKTGSKEDLKNNQTTYTFNGLLSIGLESALSNPTIVYKITGTFQEPSGVLTVTGKETTVDKFFLERSGSK